MTASGTPIPSNPQVRYLFIQLSFDALALDMYIMSIGSYITFDILTILRENATDLIIPNGYFGRAAITSFSISDNKDLMRIDIGNNTFGSVRSFELISKIRVLVLIHRSSSITVCGTWWLCIR